MLEKLDQLYQREAFSEIQLERLKELKEENLSLPLLFPIPYLCSSLKFLGCPQEPPTFSGEGKGQNPQVPDPSGSTQDSVEGTGPVAPAP